jgi:hypothetical protein
MQNLTGGVFGHLAYSENGLMIEIENSGANQAVPIPILAHLSVKSSLNLSNVEQEICVYVNPNQEVRVEVRGGPSGGAGVVVVNPEKNNLSHQRSVVAAFKVQDITAENWFIECTLSWKKASLDDFVELDSARLMKGTTLPPPEELSVAQIEAAGRPFLDVSFPPTKASLYINNSSEAGAFPVQFRRPHEFYDSPTLFANPPTSGDVKQGRLGDCWFLGALSVLSSDQILNLFETRSLSPTGVYACRFYSGYRTTKVVIIDDLIPCSPTTGYLPFDLSSAEAIQNYVQGRGVHKTSGPCYSRAQTSGGQELWVPLIEKAYAKLHRSYEAISGG